jgi:predicted phage tail protein
MRRASLDQNGSRYFRGGSRAVTRRPPVAVLYGSGSSRVGSSGASASSPTPR